MLKLPVHSGSLSRNRNSDQTQDQNILQQAIRLLDQLYRLRLIDRIARPRQKSAKQSDISQFGSKLDTLHERLNRIRSEIIQANLHDNLNSRNKSMFGQATNKAIVDWKKYIRLIQTKYNEILIQGSFKYCKKVCDLLGLRYTANLQLMLIDDWAHQCLQPPKNQSCC